MTEADVAISAAESADFDDAARLRAGMAREEDRGWDERFPGWQARFAEYFRRRQQRGDSQVYVARRGGEVVGVAAFSITDEYRTFVLGQPRAHVNSVYVIPALRRRGIARRLMEAGLAWMRERGCVLARLRTSKAGRPLYASLGFVEGSEMELEL